MKGCDNTCSFCIVPFTRGKEVSRTPGEILTEIHALERRGIREVMLLGQNVNSYGKRLEPKMNFSKLLRLIDQETGIARLRFTSPHPKDLSRELIEEYGSGAPRQLVHKGQKGRKILRRQPVKSSVFQIAIE